MCPSESMPGRGPLTAVPADEFSSTVTEAFLRSRVLVVPLVDQGLSPSWLVARTCTSYRVPLSRPVSVALVVVLSSLAFHSVQPVTSFLRYCTS